MVFESTHKPFIKFCGMTRIEDVKYAVSLGVDAVGMVLVPSASRGISIEKAQELRSVIPDHIAVVVVVQNPDEAFVKSIIDDVKPNFIQFHGDESPAFCAQFGVPFWKAIAVQSKDSARQLMQMFPMASAIVFDAWSPSGSGGHGIGFNWALIPLEFKLPRQQFILAGGLTAEMIPRTEVLIRQGGIDIIDVSSGIEEPNGQKGLKSLEQMTQFMDAVSQLYV